jgi:hypothetical protein
MDEMPAKEAEQIPYLFRHPIRMNPVWTDQAILRVSMPEGSKLVVALPPESAIPIEYQTQAGRAGGSIGQPPGTPAVRPVNEGEIA